MIATRIWRAWSALSGMSGTGREGFILVVEVEDSSASGGKAKFLLARSLACTSQREKRALGLAVAVGCLSPIAPARTVEALADFSSTNRDNHILTPTVLSGSVAHLAGVNACCMRIAGSACCTPKSRDTAVRIWLAHYCSRGDAAIRPRLHCHESSLARCPPTPRHGPCLLAAGRCGCCSCCMSVAITTSRIATRCRMVAAERCRMVQGVISQAASRARGSHPHFSHSAPSHWPHAVVPGRKPPTLYCCALSPL